MQRETLVDRNSSGRNTPYERDTTARRVRFGQGYAISRAMRQAKPARDTAACFQADIGAFNAMSGRKGNVSWKVRWLHVLDIDRLLPEPFAPARSGASNNFGSEIAGARTFNLTGRRLYNEVPRIV